MSKATQYLLIGLVLAMVVEVIIMGILGVNLGIDCDTSPQDMLNEIRCTL